MNTLYDHVCHAVVLLCVALALVGLIFPAAQPAVIALVVLGVFFLLTGGLVFLVVLGARIARWCDRMLR